MEYITHPFPTLTDDKNNFSVRKLNIPETHMPRIVIAGGGFAGITLAKKLKHAGYQVVLLDKNNYHTFQPLLYQVATAGLEPDSIAFPIRKILKDRADFHFRMAKIIKIDATNRHILTDIGLLRYDIMVLATGSRTHFYGMKGAEAYGLGLKDIQDALAMRSYILQNFEQALLTTDVTHRDALMNFVIAGAGPTGVEIAGALAELRLHILPIDYPELDLRRMRIHLIEGNERVLGGMRDKSSRAAREALEKMGVEIWLNCKVNAYDGMQIELSNGQMLQSLNLIWSAGVKGNFPDGLPPDSITPGGRIKVNHFNQVQGLEYVYAIGDVASMDSDALPNGHPMVAQVAIQQAEHLIRNLTLKAQRKPMIPFLYNDKGSMATIGRNRAVADLGNLSMKGILAWLVWMVVHLISLAGFRNKLVVFINWTWSYLSYDKGNRLIVGNTTKSKRKL